MAVPTIEARVRAHPLLVDEIAALMLRSRSTSGRPTVGIGDCRNVV